MNLSFDTDSDHSQNSNATGKVSTTSASSGKSSVAEELNALRQKGLATTQKGKFKSTNSSFLTPEEAENYLANLRTRKKSYKPPLPSHSGNGPLSSSDLNDWYAQQRRLDAEEKKRREEAEAFLRGYRGRADASGNGNNPPQSPVRSRRGSGSSSIDMVVEEGIEHVSDEVKKFETNLEVDVKEDPKTDDGDDDGNDDEIQNNEDGKVVSIVTDDEANDAAEESETPKTTREKDETSDENGVENEEPHEPAAVETESEAPIEEKVEEIAENNVQETSQTEEAEEEEELEEVNDEKEEDEVPSPSVVEEDKDEKEEEESIKDEVMETREEEPEVVKEDSEKKEEETVGSNESLPSDADIDQPEDIPVAKWRRWISSDPGEVFQPEAGRYHLYISHACPHSHRVSIVLALKGLQDTISVTFVHPTWQYTSPDTDTHRGWVFGSNDDENFTNTDGFGSFPSNWGEEDPHNEGIKSIRELYQMADDTIGKYTVPILWCTKEKTIVNNRSSDIIRILNTEFNDFASNPKLDLCAEDKKDEIDVMNDWLHRDLNEGVYNCGLAESQEEYDIAIDKMNEAFDRVEFILQKQRFLMGETFSEADVRLFVTLFRFDEIYHSYFKANSRAVESSSALMKFMREIFRMDGVENTCNMKMIKAHYYTSHVEFNKYGIIPRGEGFVAMLKSSQ